MTNWIRKLKGLGLLPLIKLLDRVDESRWEESEKEYIAKLKAAGCRLTNVHAGGTGGYQGLPSKERYEKVSRALRGRKAKPETIERLRLAHLGKKMSLRTVAKKSVAARKQWAEGRGRPVLLLTVDNKTQNVHQWAIERNLSPDTIYSRLFRGCSPEVAVNPRLYANGCMRTNQKKAWETRRKRYGKKGRLVAGRYSEGQRARYA